MEQKEKLLSPSIATTGVEYDAVVNLTDAFYNVVTGGSMPTVRLTSTDPNDNEATYAHGNPQSLDPSTGNGTIGVFFHTSSSWTLTATDLGSTYQSDTSTTVFVQPNSATQFLVVLPGESYAPGTATGKLGTPAVITAGENTSATFLITDLYYNLVNVVQNPINITTNDLYDTDPGAFAITGGSVTVSTFNLRTARTGTTITVVDADASAPALPSANSAAFTVAPSTATRLQLVLPGETVQPGNAALTRGVVGTPTAAQSGINIPIQVRLTDTYWNLTGSSSSVRLISSDPFDQSTGPWVGTGKDPYDFVVTNGSGTFNFPLISISTTGWILTASDTDDNPAPYPLRFTSFTSTSIVVNAGPPVKLITVLPGETVASGTQNGKTGTPSTATAGVEIDVQVYVADAFNNVVTVPPAVAGTNTGDVQISVENNTDPYVVIPTTVKALTPVSGFASYQMTLYKAGVHTIAGDDVTLNRGLPWTRSLSSSLTVQPSTATHLLALMPGETPLPGSGSPGKTGSPSQQVAGATFTVTVEIVDDYFNPQPNHTTENLRVDTSDPFDTQPGTATYTNGTATDGFILTLRTAAANHTINAVDTNVLDPGTTWFSSASGPFTVVASSASRVLTLLPGETYVAGSLLGKTGTPSNQVAGVSFPIAVQLTDEQFNPVPGGTMPTIKLVSSDPLEEYVSANPNALVNGNRTYTMKAKTSTTTFSITASTDATTAPATTGVKIGQSSGMRVWPAPAYYFTFTNLPSTAAAGSTFNGTIVVKDQFANIISTGPNLYTGTIHFDAETVSNAGLTDPVQDPILPPDYTFLTGDAGIKNFVGGSEGNFILKKAGSRWLKAYDFGDSNISTERPGFSTRPFINIVPSAPFQFLYLSPVDLTDNVADGQVVISAGNLSNLGKVQLVAQLADQFNNSISSVNYPVNFTVINVLGSTGTVRHFDGSSYNLISSSITDANGQLGADGSFFYFVSTKSADSAQVHFYNGSVTGDTLPLVTRGGTPSKLVLINPPASSTVGTWTANQFTLERRDDFDNSTYESVTNVSLLLGTGQSTTHANDNKPFYFTQPLDQSSHINTLTFNIGTSQMKFSYFDTMSSTPVGEHNRLGTWQLRVEGSPLTPVVYEFLMNPRPDGDARFRQFQTYRRGRKNSLPGSSVGVQYGIVGFVPESDRCHRDHQSCFHEHAHGSRRRMTLTGSC